MDRRSRSRHADDSVEAGAERSSTRGRLRAVYPYIGLATVQMGLYSPKDGKRSAADGRRQRTARLQGRHAEPVAADREHLRHVQGRMASAGSRPDNATVQWQWTKKIATIAFRNPKARVTLYLMPTIPDDVQAKRSRSRCGERAAVDTVTITPKREVIHADSRSPRALGTGEMAEVRLDGRQDIRSCAAAAGPTVVTTANSASGCSTRSSSPAPEPYARASTDAVRRLWASRWCRGAPGARRHRRRSCSRSGRTLSVKRHRVEGDRSYWTFGEAGRSCAIKRSSLGSILTRSVSRARRHGRRRPAPSFALAADAPSTAD